MSGGSADRPWGGRRSIGRGPIRRRFTWKVAVALAPAAAGAVGLLHLLPGSSSAGVAQAQISPREAPQISALTQATTSAIAMIWLPADNTDVHWLYAVKADGNTRFRPRIARTAR